MNAMLPCNTREDAIHEDIPDDGSHAFVDRATFGLELTLILTDLLEAVAGREDAAGYIDVIAHRLGSELTSAVLRKQGLDHLDLGQICRLLVDLKRRIGGTFTVESVGDRRIVLRATTCPFGQRVVGRASLCNMTSGVFGRIVADNTGYARVVLDKTIARGDQHCRVVIDLTPPESGPETDMSNAREYFGT